MLRFFKLHILEKTLETDVLNSVEEKLRLHLIIHLASRKPSPDNDLIINLTGKGALRKELFGILSKLIPQNLREHYQLLQQNSKKEFFEKIAVVYLDLIKPLFEHSDSKYLRLKYYAPDSHNICGELNVDASIPDGFIQTLQPSLSELFLSIRDQLIVYAKVSGASYEMHSLD